jgi:hypothetical protein
MCNIHESMKRTDDNKNLQGKAVWPRADWVTMPEKASMARRPFLSSLTFNLSAPFLDKPRGSNE